jgi:hypothetical protein
MQMVWIHGHPGRVVSRRDTYHTYTLPREIDDKSRHDPTQTAIAVFFGIFRIEEIILPIRITSTEKPTLTAELAVFARDKEAIAYIRDRLPSGSSVSVFFDWIHGNSGHPNVVEETGHPVPPLILKFFEYSLRRYTGLQFKDSAFQGIENREFDDLTYGVFLETLGIFADDGSPQRNDCLSMDSLYLADFIEGTELLASSDQVSTLVFSRQ